MTLRPYQWKVIQRLREMIAQGHRHLILQASTGSGKTVIAAAIIAAAIIKGKRVIFFAHMRELVNQCADKLAAFGVDHGVIMAGEEIIMAPVQVVSKDTMLSWLRRHKLDTLPEADLVFVDECHRSTSKGQMSLLAKYPNAIVIGLTATPARKNGRGLGTFYSIIVPAASYAELIADGYLVPMKVYAPFRPDLKGVKVSGSDYDKRELGRRMDKLELVGDIFENWKRLAGDRQTLIFTASISHSLHVVEVFQKHGIRAAHIDGKTPIDERLRIMAALESGDLQVVSNCSLFVEGVDVPSIGCIILAKPTRSFVRFLQMIGRGMRPALGKTECLLLDHSGAVYMHGMPGTEIEWSLDAKQSVDKQVKAKPKPNVCPKCHAAFMGSKCPECGFIVQKMPKRIKTRGGMLVEIDSASSPEHRHEILVRVWHSCLGMAANMGRTAGMAASVFKQRTGLLPWECRGLPNMPKGSWRVPVAEIFPQYLGRRR